MYQKIAERFGKLQLFWKPLVRASASAGLQMCCNVG